MNIHLFDGQIITELNKYKKDFSNLDKLEILTNLAHNWNKHLNISGKKLLDIIISDIGKPANYDQTNHMSAEDVLILIHFQKIDSPDFFQNLNEQFTDMVTGQCSQGRVIRLFQLYISFK